MKAYFVGLSLLAICATSASAAEIKKGDTAFIPRISIINVMNLDGIGEYAYNSPCIMDAGATMIATAFNGKNVLARHLNIPGTMNPKLCPSGTLFFISKEEFASANETYKNILAAEQAQRKLVEELLKQE